MDWNSVKIGKKLIFQVFWNLSKCRMLQGDQNNDFSVVITKKEIEAPRSGKTPYILIGAKVCVVNSKFVYVTGGREDGNGDPAYPDCDRYDVAKNKWEEMPPMNQARFSHSSCHLGAFIYVFGGTNSQKQEFNSVEKLSIDAKPKLKVSKQWEVIPEVNLTALPAICGHFSIPLNEKEIVILGGYDYDEPYV